MKISISGLVFAAAGAMAALCLVAALTTVPARAGSYGSARWCAVVDEGGDNLTWECEYDSQEDCMPAILAGNRGFCSLNPYWRDSATDGRN